MDHSSDGCEELEEGLKKIVHCCTYEAEPN